MNFRLTILIISIIIFNHLYSQDSTIQINQSYINKGKLTRLIISESLFYVGGMSYLQFVWYKDHDRVPFHYYNDNSGYLQIDKFGHAFGAYLESYIGYYWLRSAGVNKKKALIYGGSLGIILQAPIEIFDGLYEGYGFSWGDIATNTFGSVFFIGQELLFDEQVLKYKFSFWRSEYADQANGYLGNNYLESLFYDYNGHTYWLSTNANRYFLKERLPDWLNIAIGYSANGMFGEFENKTIYKGVLIPKTERYRQFLLSLDIDLTKINTHSKLLNNIFEALSFIKIPLPTLEINSKGQFKGYWLYF
ncbi:MAG: DUF2279 domain-containing protein [Bacteroidales bacterium]|nr:DUF2279 domain-containing protein [Bacteroidales bacterium]